MIRNLFSVVYIGLYSLSACYSSQSSQPQDTSSLIEKIMSTVGLHGPHVLCGEGNAPKGIYSLRSFNGQLCKKPYIGALATLLCMRTPGFHDSHCAKNISPSKIGSSAVIENEIKGNSTALKLFCAIAQKSPKTKGFKSLSERYCHN